jgi:hypothetical protein
VIFEYFHFKVPPKWVVTILEKFEKEFMLDDVIQRPSLYEGNLSNTSTSSSCTPCQQFDMRRNLI